jgi:hypothetical protein
MASVSPSLVQEPEAALVLEIGIRESNGIKLSSNMLLYQGVTCYSTRFHEERVRLGPTFDGTGLDAVRAVRIDHQQG